MRAGGRAQRLGVAVGVRWVRVGRLPSRTRTQIHPLPRAAGGWALTSWLAWSQTLQAVLTRPEQEDTEAQPESPGENVGGLRSLGDGAGLLGVVGGVFSSCLWEGSSRGSSAAGVHARGGLAAEPQWECGP